MKKKIKSIIYDMDGLLLDTEPFYTIATQEVVGKYGKTFEWSLKSKMMGRPAIESAHLLVDTLNIPLTAEEYLEQREGVLRKLCPTSEPLPGAVALTREASMRAITQAVATSSKRDVFELKTQRHKEWFSVFDVIITGDDKKLTKGKPFPDIYLLAAEELKTKPENCLVFEDSPTGLKAGIAAGMNTIAVPDPNLNKNLFEKADQILNSLEAFDFNCWDL